VGAGSRDARLRRCQDFDVRRERRRTLFPAALVAFFAVFFGDFPGALLAVFFTAFLSGGVLEALLRTFEDS